MPKRMNLALARQQLKDTIMMQQIPRTLHLGKIAPRTKPPRATTALSNITVARLNMPVVLTQMRKVLQSAISLALLAKIANELAITPINAFSHLKISAAKAQLPRSFQATLSRVHMCPQRLLEPTSAPRSFGAQKNCPKLAQSPLRGIRTFLACQSRLLFAKCIDLSCRMLRLVSRPTLSKLIGSSGAKIARPQQSRSGWLSAKVCASKSSRQQMRSRHYNSPLHS